MSKRMTDKEKKKEKKNNTAKNKYVRLQNPFDFRIADEKPTYKMQIPFSVYYNNQEHSIRLLKGDCIDVLKLASPNSVDMIFADPPYFLSNSGITCQAGRMVTVDKGKWDKSKGGNVDHEFAIKWLTTYCSKNW